MTDFTLGVNYWPRRKAMYWWSNFDAGEVRAEFAIIKSIGMNVVRIFLLWDDFQPEPNMVAKDKLDDLVKVADIAAETGLGLDLTFFTGHMSGPNWSPRWLLGGDLPPKAHQHWLRDVVSDGRTTDKGYRNMFKVITQNSHRRAQGSPRHLDVEPRQRTRFICLAQYLR
jgi:hypothetical protein